MKDERDSLLKKDKPKNDPEKNVSNSRIISEEPESDLDVNDLSPDDDNNDEDDVDDNDDEDSDENSQMEELELSNLETTETNDEFSELELSGLSPTEANDQEDVELLTPEDDNSGTDDSIDDDDVDVEENEDDLNETLSQEVEESGIKTSRNKNIKSYNNDIKNMSTNKKRTKLDNVGDGNYKIKLKKYRGTRLIDPHIGANFQKKNSHNRVQNRNYQNYENGYTPDNFDYPEQMDSGPKINSIGNFFGVTPNSLAQYGQKFGNQQYPVGQFPPNQTKQVPTPLPNENDIINRYMAANAGNMSYAQPDMGYANARAQPDMGLGNTRAPNDVNFVNRGSMQADAGQMASQQMAAQQLAAQAQQQAMMQQAMGQQAMGQQAMPDQQAMMEMMRQNQTGGYHPNPNFFFQH
jgi:hypothetical protein